EALGQAEELDAHVHGAGGVEQAAALRAVKDDVAVGVVVDEEDIVLFGEGHQLLVQGRVAHAAHGVGGQGDDHILGPAGDALGDVLYIGQKVVLFDQGIVVRHSPGQLGPGDEHGVAGVGQKDGVALIAQHHADVAAAFLAAIAAGHLVGGDVHPEAALVVAADRGEHLGDVPQAVLPVFGVGGRAGQRLDDVGRGGKVRRAHAQVVDRAALGLQRHFLVVQGREDLVPEQLHPLGKFHPYIPSP